MLYQPLNNDRLGFAGRLGETHTRQQAMREILVRRLLKSQPLTAVDQQLLRQLPRLIICQRNRWNHQKPEEYSLEALHLFKNGQPAATPLAQLAVERGVASEEGKSSGVSPAPVASPVLIAHSSSSISRNARTIAITSNPYFSATAVFARRTSEMTGSATTLAVSSVFIVLNQLLRAAHHRQPKSRLANQSTQPVPRVRIRNVLEVPRDNVIH
jgi:hypothetical protein